MLDFIVIVVANKMFTAYVLCAGRAPFVWCLFGKTLLNRPQFFRRWWRKSMNGNLTFQTNIAASVHNAAPNYISPSVYKLLMHLNKPVVIPKHDICIHMTLVHAVSKPISTTKRTMATLIGWDICFTAVTSQASIDLFSCIGVTYFRKVLWRTGVAVKRNNTGNYLIV